MTFKRMFSLKILGSTEFLTLKPSEQILYVHLCMRADDDGFISNPSVILRALGIRSSNIKRLIESGFLLGFPNSKAVAVKHWHLHNQIKEENRWNTNNCGEEKRLITLNDQGEYQLKNDAVNELKNTQSRTENGIKSVPKMSRESVENKRIEKEIDRKEKVLEKEKLPSPATASMEEVKEIFNIHFDDTPTRDIASYRLAKIEYDKSEFARKSFVTISVLDRHLDRLIAGAYADFKRTPKYDVIHNVIPQTYTKEEIDSVFIDVTKVDLDNI